MVKKVPLNAGPMFFSHVLNWVTDHLKGGGWQYFHTCLFQLAKVTEEQKRTEKEDTVNTINMPVYGQTVKAW